LLTAKLTGRKARAYYRSDHPEAGATAAGDFFRNNCGDTPQNENGVRTESRAPFLLTDS